MAKKVELITQWMMSTTPSDVQSKIVAECLVEYLNYKTAHMGLPDDWDVGGVNKYYKSVLDGSAEEPITLFTWGHTAPITIGKISPVTTLWQNESRCYKFEITEDY